MTDPAFLTALLAAILSAASMVLHVVAPRTKTTIDDNLRDDIDEVLAFVRGQAQAPASTPPPAKVPMAGRARLVVLGVLMAIGASIAIAALLVGGCAATKAEIKAAAAGAVTCAKADLSAVEALGIQFATEAAVSALAGNG